MIKALLILAFIIVLAVVDAKLLFVGLVGGIVGFLWPVDISRYRPAGR